MITSSERGTLIADVDNLFDTEYAHVVGDEHVQQSLTMDGMTYRVGLRFRF